MENKEVNLTRRQFLSGATVIGALGAAALVGTKIEVEAAAIDGIPSDPPADGGYHETEHIQKYYQSARF